MKSRPAIAQYEATVVLVVISLSLASIVYAGLRRESSLGTQPVFFSEETPIGGTPTIERVSLNSSTRTTISSFSIDGESSSGGIMEFNGSSYSTVNSLCDLGATTFFSVLASQTGTIEVATNGQPWVSGTWGSAVEVSSGWHEVMIQGGSTCSVTLPGGETVPDKWNSSSPLLSSIPVEGGLTGTTFAFYLPRGGGSHDLLLTSSGGFDHVAL